tara:strand:+ start:1400 stop:1696 length:297 start_codon:yes stop_codon:yes gene_type:complete
MIVDTLKNLKVLTGKLKEEIKMQLTTKQIIKMLKEIDNEAIDVGLHSTCPVTDKKVGLGVKLINTPVRSERPVDNLFAMQDWAMRELWKHLEINKTKS